MVSKFPATRLRVIDFRAIHLIITGFPAAPLKIIGFLVLGRVLKQDSRFMRVCLENSRAGYLKNFSKHCLYCRVSLLWWARSSVG